MNRTVSKVKRLASSVIMLKSFLTVRSTLRPTRRQLCTQKSKEIQQKIVDWFWNCDHQPATIFDLTFGDGQHSLGLLEHHHRVLGLDRDVSVADRYQQPQFADHNNQDGDNSGKFHGIIGRFSDLPSIINNRRWELESWVTNCDGILLDFGVSKTQLDSGRGFSIDKPDDPLDLRMDHINPTNNDKDDFSRSGKHLTAADLLRHLDVDNITSILKTHGGVRHASNIASEIVERRYLLPSDTHSGGGEITTVGDLEQAVSRALASLQLGTSFDDKERRDIVKRVVLALRLFLNNELNEMRFVVQLAEQILRPGRVQLNPWH